MPSSITFSVWTSFFVHIKVKLGFPFFVFIKVVALSVDSTINFAVRIIFRDMLYFGYFGGFVKLIDNKALF